MTKAPRSTFPNTWKSGSSVLYILQNSAREQFQTQRFTPSRLKVQWTARDCCFFESSQEELEVQRHSSTQGISSVSVIMHVSVHDAACHLRTSSARGAHWLLVAHRARRQRLITIGTESLSSTLLYVLLVLLLSEGYRKNSPALLYMHRNKDPLLLFWADLGHENYRACMTSGVTMHHDCVGQHVLEKPGTQLQLITANAKHFGS